MRFLINMIFLSLATMMWAQETDTNIDMSRIDMKADRSVFNQASNQTKLIGNAEIYGNNLHLFADEITIQLGPSSPEGGGQTLKELIAIGNVRAQAEAQSIEADEMHYDHETQIAIFTGNARVYQEGGEATAKQIILNVKEESFELIGAVHGILEGL